MELIPRPYGHPDVVALTTAVQAHYQQLYGGPGEGLPVAMGGWRRLGERPGLPSPNAAEVKRMYVAPSTRGRGLSRIVLAELEASARSAGVDWLVLETGRPQRSAIGLYRASGYTDVDGTPYGHYVGHPDAVHLGRSIV